MSIVVVDPKGNAVQALRFINTQALAVGATSTTATDVATDIIRLVADIAICYTFESATAATTDIFLPANVVEYPVVGAAQLAWISATEAGAGRVGTVWISEAV